MTDGYLIAAAQPDASQVRSPPALAALAEAASLAKARIGLGRVLAERATEQRLRRMLQHSSDIIAVLDLDLSIRYLSPGAERLLGGRPPVRRRHQLAGRRVPRRPGQGERNHRGVHQRTARTGRVPPACRRRITPLRRCLRDASHRARRARIRADLPRRDRATRPRAALSYQAFHDSLTGLANRSLFRDRLEHAITRSTRSVTRFAVLFIDLDDFKDVNDSLGHAAGDSMLRQMTLRLGEAVREEDTVARLGGDEFAILLESVDKRR